MIAGSAPAAAAAAIAALVAALCWTVASLLWRRLPTSLSPARLNLLKNLIAFAVLLPPAVLLPWRVPAEKLLPVALSGVLGIALGDTLFLAALRRLGTRRALLVDAGGPAVTTAAGVVLLGEVPGPRQWLGIGLISLAVLLVAHQRPPAAPVATPAAGPGRGVGGAAAGWAGTGLALGVAALLCGSGGALLARAALRDGQLLPLQAATLRLGAASLALLPLLRGLPRPGRHPRPATPRWPLLLAATLLGTCAGIVLQQTAIAGLPGGVAVALLATAPVMAVPLAPLEGDRPGLRGLVAALVSLAGVSLVVGLLPPGAVGR